MATTCENCGDGGRVYCPICHANDPIDPRESMARRLFAAYQRELRRREIKSIELSLDVLNADGRAMWLAIADAALGGES